MEIVEQDNPVYLTAYEKALSSNDYQRIRKLVRSIHPVVVGLFEPKKVTPTTDMASLSAQLRPHLLKTLENMQIKLPGEQVKILEDMLTAELVGLGPLEPLIQDETVSDILVNGYQQVFVERYGRLQPTQLSCWDSDHLMSLIHRILSRINRRVDELMPYINARLPDGSRVNVIIPPLSPKGPILSIRKFHRQFFTLEDMVENNSLTKEIVDLLTIAIHSRLNVIITGGAGTGKTTLLNALAHTINPNERIITVEDICELRLELPHCVSLEAREANIEGKGLVALRDLFINALRMRPDRIIVGESRGAEVFEMLQAMNTGHDGSLSTLHASSPKEVPIRIANMVSMAGFNIPIDVVFRQLVDCIDMIVEVQRLPDGHRFIHSIVECLQYKDGLVELSDVVRFDFNLQRYVFSDVSDHFKERAQQVKLDTALKNLLSGIRHE